MYQTKNPSQGLVSLPPFELEIIRVGMTLSTMSQNLSAGNNKVIPAVQPEGFNAEISHSAVHAILSQFQPPHTVTNYLFPYDPS